MARLTKVYKTQASSIQLEKDISLDQPMNILYKGQIVVGIRFLGWFSLIPNFSPLQSSEMV